MCNITESKLAECQRENRELRARVEQYKELVYECQDAMRDVMDLLVEPKVFAEVTIIDNPDEGVCD